LYAAPAVHLRLDGSQAAIWLGSYHLGTETQNVGRWDPEVGIGHVHGQQAIMAGYGQVCDVLDARLFHRVASLGRHA
jgi:hypothetical protein